MAVKKVNTSRKFISPKWHVQHVFSGEVSSSIFDHLVNYFKTYSPGDWSVESVDHPSTAHVYHYHRPQLENKLSSPSIVTVHHDLDETDEYVAFEKFEPRYHEATKIVCLNNAQKNSLEKIGITNTVVIPHGYNDRVISNITKKRIVDSNQKFVLGLTSRRYGRRVKGEALLYEYAKRLPTDKFAFFLIGAGRSTDGTMLAEMGFEVKVLEYIPYNLFGEVYKNMDALLVLSWHEGGPACVPEAVASGTPVYGVEVGMVPDYLNHLENGIILTRDIDLDVENIIKVVQNKNGILDNIVLNAYRRRGEALTWKDVINQHFSLYREIANV